MQPEIPGTLLKQDLTVERVANLDALEAYRESWSELLGQNQTRAIELTYEWQLTHWKYFGQNAQLFVLLVKQADALLAIAPWKLTTVTVLGVRIRRLEFIAAAESTYEDLIIGTRHEEVLSAIRAYLLENHRAWDVVSLEHIPDSSPTAQFLRRELEHQRLSCTSSERCMFLRTGGQWDAYAAHSKRSRDRVRYYLRRLEKSGRVSFTGSADETQLQSNLNCFFELHRKRWNQTDTPSHFNDDRYSRFYLDVAPQLLVKKQLDLFVLSLDQSPLALILVFRYGSEGYFMQLTAFDPDFSIHSPSLIAIEMSVKRSFADEMQIFDLGHYYPYKELWADGYSATQDFEIYASRLAPICAYVVSQTSQFVRGHLRDVPGLRKALGALRRLRMSSAVRAAEKRDKLP